MYYKILLRNRWHHLNRRMPILETIINKLSWKQHKRWSIFSINSVLQAMIHFPHWCAALCAMLLLDFHMMLNVDFRNGNISLVFLLCEICFAFTLSSFQKLIQYSRSGSSDLRSQTPSPHFGPLTMNVPKNDRDIYRSNAAHIEGGVNQSLTNRNMMNMELTTARVPSPHQVGWLLLDFNQLKFSHETEYVFWCVGCSWTKSGA